MIGWTALLLAVFALVRTVRWPPRREPAPTPILEPVEIATPEQYGHVTQGGPLGHPVEVRRVNATRDEMMIAGAYLHIGQTVRIDTDTAYPVPDFSIRDPLRPIGWKP